jgi:hypothetical protein
MRSILLAIEPASSSLYVVEARNPKSSEAFLIVN